MAKFKRSILKKEWKKIFPTFPISDDDEDDQESSSKRKRENDIPRMVVTIDYHSEFFAEEWRLLGSWVKKAVLFTKKKKKFTLPMPKLPRLKAFLEELTSDGHGTINIVVEPAEAPFPKPNRKPGLAPSVIQHQVSYHFSSTLFN